MKIINNEKNTFLHNVGFNDFEAIESELKL